MWWDKVISFIDQTMWLKITLEAYFIFIVVALVIYMITYSKRAIYLFIVLFLLFGVTWLSKSLHLELSSRIYEFISLAGVVFVISVLAPDFRNIISYKQDVKETFISSSENSKRQIVNAVMDLSKDKIGALITIEGHNSLDQYAERAIQLNSDISRELLINIFTPNTPLHDGAVIIRGNKIRCAGAYYVLTQHSEIDKTTGSRHRAGIGISEVTDSLTIIVSEETGKISITTEGFMIPIENREKLLQYIEMFIDKK